MNTPKNEGGSVHPNDGSWGNNYPERGMSLREYLAAKAMAGFVVAEPQWDIETTANEAVKMADALIKELEK